MARYFFAAAMARHDVVERGAFAASLGGKPPRFVGLIAPHAVRAAVQPTHRWLLPLSALAGGVLLLAADVLARWLLAPQELPVGVLTAVLGGGYLLWIMHRRPA